MNCWHWNLFDWQKEKQKSSVIQAKRNGRRANSYPPPARDFQNIHDKRRKSRKDSPVATSLWSSYRLQVLRNNHHTAARPFRPRLDSVTEEPEEDEVTVLSVEISSSLSKDQNSMMNGSICSFDKN